MKKDFPYKLFIFWILALALGIGLATECYSRLVMNNTIQQQKERLFLKNKNQFTIWVMGDSHPLLAFDPGLVKGSFNWAGTSENFVLNYHKLKYLLQNGHKPVQIILSAEYHSFSSQGMNLLKNHELDDCYWSKRISITKFVSETGDHDLYRWWFSARFIPFAGQYFHLFSSLFKAKQPVGNSGFLPSEEVFDLNPSFSKDLEAKIESHTSGHNLVDSVQVFYLKKIVELCQSNEILLTFIRYPIHPEYRKLLAKRANLSAIDSIYSSVFKEVPLHDFTRFFDLKTRHFSDPDHLNLKGAEIFTSLLRDSILSIPVTKP
ncbi:MAG TPA: hypothetical protein PKY12_04340 [Catalimonadaceae bacterium]|nr:hypothetical protein [Catalimonadaceae bacterium]